MTTHRLLAPRHNDFSAQYNYVQLINNIADRAFVYQGTF